MRGRCRAGTCDEIVPGGADLELCAPYAFQSTMIRIDLNGYTQIFLEKKDEYVTDIVPP